MIRSLLPAFALALAVAGCAHPYQTHPCARPDLAGCVIEKVTVRGGGALDDSAVTDKIATAETSHALGGILEDVPINLPALLRALKLQNRAARVGFDWDSAPKVVEKIAEEAGEIAESAESAENVGKNGREN